MPELLQVSHRKPAEQKHRVRVSVLEVRTHDSNVYSAVWLSRCSVAERIMAGPERVASACLLIVLVGLGTRAQHTHHEAHARQLPRWVLCTMARDQLPFLVEWIEFNRYVSSWPLTIAPR